MPKTKPLDKSNIPIFILAGGMGTRLSEETAIKPKPMVEIGEIPILLHIMRWYYAHGFRDFVICAGYRSWDIKEFFLTYEFRCNHLCIDHRERTSTPPFSLGRNAQQEAWRVDIIDTGLNNMTGSRLAQAIDEVAKHRSFNYFGLTYGDGLSDVNLDAELAFHLEHGKVGTVLGVPPLARFGELDVNDASRVDGFLEKPEARGGGSIINGGFFFFNRKFRNYLSPEANCILERAPLSKLANDGELMTYRHMGFWHPMDTLRDKMILQSIWDSGEVPWRKSVDFDLIPPDSRTSEVVGHT